MTVNVGKKEREGEKKTATKVVSHSSVALWYALKNLFCNYKVTFAIYEMF